ncbi:MAG: sigma 54-interacting transcriptional regulator [Polyangiaceae bacterium]
MSGGEATEALGREEAGTFQRFVATVTDGPDLGASIASTDARVVIGTADVAHLRLKDTAVSRFHCELSPTQGGLLLRDLGSRNGVLVGGVTVREAIVPFGTTLHIGRNQITLSSDAELQRVPLSREQRFGQLVGESVPMRQAFALLSRAAASDATVLLTGETGTGKEAAAHALHEASPRRSGPFVVVDCASVPSNLFEAELFGHDRGAFTGAVVAREGAFEMADGGTLFIDEIGELGADLQPKLLRVLERREVKRVGGSKTVPVDVRVIAATHRDLRSEVNAKRFRSDLYYRLAVVPVRLPSLRERPEDLPLIVRALSASIAKRARVSAERLADPTFLAELANHSWPGNVRELRNYLERALVLGDGAEIEPLAPDGDVGAALIDVSRPLKEERERVLNAFEKDYLERVLAKTSGNVPRAAEAAGVDRVHFYRLLRKHSIPTRPAD